MSIKHWLQAARPRTLPLASSSVLAAGGAALQSQLDFDWLVFSLALFTVVLLQVLSNFANDLGDHEHGVDDAGRVGPQRAIQQGVITPKSMRRAVVITSVLAFVCGCVLLFSSRATQANSLQWLVFFILGILAIVAAIKYTVGNSAYGYFGLGDVSVFLFFGLIGVLGIQFLLGLSIPDLDWTPAIFVGACSAAVLNANNLRDMENDEQKGKRTLIVLMGFTIGRWYQALLLIIGIASGLVCLMPLDNGISIVALMPLLVLSGVIVQTLREGEPRRMDRFLKRIALSTFAFTLLLFIRHLM